MTKVLWVFCVFLVNCSVLTGAPEGATIYVDKRLTADCTAGNYSLGERNCSGTGANAYRTIKAALNAMNIGDEIALRGGIYQEGHIRLNNFKSGSSWSAGNFNTIKSHDGEWAILDGQNGGGDGGLDGKKVGSDTNSYCVIGFTVSDTGGPLDLKYWRFERLEIRNGSSPDGRLAAGFQGNGGPFIFRKCIIRDNVAANGNDNPGGLRGQFWHDSLVEYCYFENNGIASGSHHNGAHINIFSDYLQDQIAHNGYHDNGRSNMRNEYRYNLFVGSQVAVKHKQDQLFSGRNAGGGHPLNDTFSTYGDKIHHNIFMTTNTYAIDARQDFVQVYNNIFDSCKSAIAIGEADSRSIYKAVVYNNTIISPAKYGIFRIHSWRYSFQPTQYYGYDFNNILDSCADGWQWSDIGVVKLSTFGEQMPDWNNYISDRNYFFRPVVNTRDSDGTKVVYIGGTRYTTEAFEAAFPGTDLFRSNYDEDNLLYEGTNNADRFKTRRVHVVEDAKTVSNGGRGGAHPYLSDVTIPSYLGAANPNLPDTGTSWDPENPTDDAGWINYVLSLRREPTVQGLEN